MREISGTAGRRSQQAKKRAVLAAAISFWERAEAQLSF
jgi:hypothetical protein